MRPNSLQEQPQSCSIRHLRLSVKVLKVCLVSYPVHLAIYTTHSQALPEEGTKLDDKTQQRYNELKIHMPKNINWLLLAIPPPNYAMKLELEFEQVS